MSELQLNSEIHKFFLPDFSGIDGNHCGHLKAVSGFGDAPNSKNLWHI